MFSKEETLKRILNGDPIFLVLKKDLVTITARLPQSGNFPMFSNSYAGNRTYLNILSEEDINQVLNQTLLVIDEDSLTELETYQTYLYQAPSCNVRMHEFLLSMSTILNSMHEADLRGLTRDVLDTMEHNREFVFHQFNAELYPEEVRDILGVFFEAITNDIAVLCQTTLEDGSSGIIACYDFNETSDDFQIKIKTDKGMILDRRVNFDSLVQVLEHTADVYRQRREDTRLQSDGETP